MSNRRLPSSAKIVTAPASIVSTSSRSTIKPAVELCAPQVAERVVLDHDHPLIEARARRRHPPQSTAEGLLGQDLRLRGQRSQGDDHADVADVPALAQHQHADDAADLAVGPIDLAGRSPGDIEIRLRDLPRAVGMDHEQPVARELRALAQIVARLVCRLRVLAHHKEDWALARGRERLVELAPPPDRNIEPLPISLDDRVAELDRRARDLADDRRLHDPIGNRLRERVVDDDVSEDLALLILRRRREVELGDNPGLWIVGRAFSFSSACRRSIDWFHCSFSSQTWWASSFTTITRPRLATRSNSSSAEFVAASALTRGPTIASTAL